MSRMDKYRGRFYSAIGVNKGISSKKLDTILHENLVGLKKKKI